MKNQHLSDAEIQQYALQKSSCEKDILEHMQLCKNCMSKAEQYKALFSAIEKQEKPIFALNLSDLVLEQLPKRKQKVAHENLFIWTFVFISIFSIGTFSYLFGEVILDMFIGIKTVLMGLMITTTATIFIFLTTDIYKKHLTQLQALNFY